MKICISCKIEKPLDAFPKDARKPDGRQYSCTHCTGKRSARYRRDWEIKRDFGISLDEYEKLKTPCVICGVNKNLHLDHNHVTKKIREFLCVNCNMGIGQFKENIHNMKKAIAYLEKHSD